LFGLSRGTQKSQIIRAVLESIALQNVQLLTLMEAASGQKLSRVGVDGGASRNDFLMQFQADTLQTNMVRPKNTETTSVGAARAAKMGWDALHGIKNTEISVDNTDQAQTFAPKIPKDLAKAMAYRWMHAVECVNQFYK
jgi:glycerol kinase